jgi:hypothetical protein
VSTELDSPNTDRFGYLRALIVLACWIALVFLWGSLNIKALAPIFPFSALDGPHLYRTGLLYAAGFLLVLWLALHLRLSPMRVWGVALVLILLANLAQGGYGIGLLKPLWHEGKQYAQDAARIGYDWRLWLDQFTDIHDQLFSHSKTHPPFAVLLNYFPLRYGGGHVLTWFFIFLGTSSIPLVNLVLRAAGVQADRSNLLTLLFAVVPAINIYSVVSLDAVVLTATTLALLGLVRLIRGKGPVWGAVVLFVAGALAANALTYAGVFILGVALVWARNRHVRVALMATVGVGLLCYVVLRLALGYDHLLAFSLASASEHPNGFRLVTWPAHYWLTRVECVGEVAAFLSVPILLAFRRRLHPITLSGVAVLLLIFLSGAFRTGETGRICMFIYPVLFLSLGHLEEPTLRPLIAYAGVQSILMQVLVDWFW